MLPLLRERVLPLAQIIATIPLPLPLPLPLAQIIASIVLRFVFFVVVATVWVAVLIIGITVPVRSCTLKTVKTSIKHFV